MKRPWQVWLVFLVCVAGAAGAMAWLTRQALDADQMRHAAEAEAELEQRVSLALWRMDTELAPIVAEEVIRPPSAYRPLNDTPVDPPKYVLLQFEARPDGTWYSPQAPRTYSRVLPRLAELSAAVNIHELLAKLPDTPLPTAAEINQKSIAAAQLPQPPDDLYGPGDPFQFFEGNTANAPTPIAPTTKQMQESAYGKGGGKVAQSKSADFEDRGARYQTAARQSLMNQQQRAIGPNSAPNVGANPATFDQAIQVPVEQAGVSRPVWVGERLLLARRVGANGAGVIQGSWLDWPQLKARLLAEAESLLPKADLVPVEGDLGNDPARMLAGLPVRLVVSESGVTGALDPTMRWALWMGWGAVLLATAAAAALLHGVMTLSERRAAFVSSVTHELRTPLTTFRMYAEMLARGMVPDAVRRQEYFQTLQREAERLTLLVENVLAYARLERGRKPQAIESVTIASLMERVGPRLAQRAQQAEMQCEVQIEPDAANHSFTTDLNVVEQILFNLVDNAAKYARAASDRRIHVIAGNSDGSMWFTVRDHGPGFEPRHVGGRMRAFGKSAQESAETAPGVGLGLALCRRLARQLGGRLDIAAASGGGAKATLLLPAK
jgi:signal transduction histidine kinase